MSPGTKTDSSNGRARLLPRLAWLCGLLPLVVGVAIFLLWLATHWPWLELAGLFTILGGFVVSLIGVLALITHVVLSLRASSPLSRWFWPSQLACISLIVANYAVAEAIVSYVTKVLHLN